MSSPTEHTSSEGLHLLDWAGGGPPIVLLPGAGGNARFFADLAAELQPRRVIAVDPPAVGPDHGLLSHDLVPAADYIHAAIRSYHAGPVVWAGHSWGGKVAAMIAGRHPAACAGAILIDPSPLRGIPLDESRLEAFVDSAWDGHSGPWIDTETALTALAALPHYRRWTERLAGALQLNLMQQPDRTWTTRTTRADIEALSRATLLIDQTENVSGATCPILYLVASQSIWWQEIGTDPVVPAHARREVIEGNHLIYLDNLPETSIAIHQWLDELKLRRTTCLPDTP